tara:strand:+ start:349 stop:546 length:198 start_codon:yes stop_codon:yes gene_type:complete
MNHKAGIPPVTKPIKKSDLTSGPTITAEDKAKIKMPITPFTLAGTAKAILEKTLKNPRVDKQETT